MRVLVYLPLVTSALLAVAGPRIANRMPPKTATRLLLAAGLACAVTSLVTLALLAWTLIGRLPLVAAVGGWSSDILDDHDPVPSAVSELAGAAFAVVTCLTGWSAARRLRSLRRTRHMCGELGSGRLVVLDQDEPEAFAIPAGRPGDGRIVVSAGLLRTLDATERRVLLAHETAHLDHRHHRHRALATLIATADPLLATLPGAIHHLTERWADEDAADTVQDRKVTARALARAALAGQRAHGRSATVMCLGDGGVPRRVRALLTGTPRRRPFAALMLAAALTTSLFSAAEAGNDTAGLFDQADDGYHARPLPITTAASRETRHLLAVLTGDRVRQGRTAVPSDRG